MGTSSAYRTVCSLNDGKGPFDVKVEELEYINHVNKRMGTCLKKLKKEEFTMTDKVTDKLTRYFGQAVCNNVNKNDDDMKKAILASYFHGISSDEKPLHTYCRSGEES